MILPFNPLLIPWHKQCRNAIRLLCTHGLPPLSLKLLGIWPCTVIMIVSVFPYLWGSFKEHLYFFFLPDTSCIQPFISNPKIRWFYDQVEFISGHCSQESRESYTSFPNYFVFASNSIILLRFSLPQANTYREKRHRMMWWQGCEIMI